MKKLPSILVALVICLSLTACAHTPSLPKPGATQTNSKLVQAGYYHATIGTIQDLILNLHDNIRTKIHVRLSDGTCSCGLCPVAQSWPLDDINEVPPTKSQAESNDTIIVENLNVIGSISGNILDENEPLPTERGTSGISRTHSDPRFHILDTGNKPHATTTLNDGPENSFTPPDPTDNTPQSPDPSTDAIIDLTPRPITAFDSAHEDLEFDQYGYGIDEDGRQYVATSDGHVCEVTGTAYPGSRPNWTSDLTGLAYSGRTNKYP